MKKILITLMSFLLVLSGCTNSDSSADKASFLQITMDDAVMLMENEVNYIILDVRTQEEYDEGHIPGSICIPNETIENEPPAQLPDKNQLILVYCRSGNRSKQASSKLAAMGYTNIREFGGIIDWPGEIEK